MARPTCIFAATDFSQTSMEALVRAREIADALDAHVHLLHVIPDPAAMPWSVDAGTSFLEIEDRWCVEAKGALERTRDMAGFNPDRTVTEVAVGDAAREIVRHASGAHADLIVVGTHGHGRLARMMLGSVADRVIRKSDRPVLVVPPNRTHGRTHVEAEEAVTP